MRLIELTETIENPELFVDLDGVLADFVAATNMAMSKVYDEEHIHDESQYEADSKYRSRMWKGLRDYQKVHGGKFWLDMPLMKDAKQLWDYVKRYPVEILSATGNPEYGAAEQKHEWVAREIDPNVKVNLTRKSMEKAQMAAPNRILIDDKSKSIDPWIQAGGIGILHTSAADTIAQLKKLGL